MLLPSPRKPRQRRASSLLLAELLLCVISVSVCAGLPAGSKCPRHIDCAREGRHFCKPGSSHCGPCLSKLEENEEGRCVARKRHHPHGNAVPYPDLDEEIDYLHSVIEKQSVSEVQPLKQPKPHVTHSQTDGKIQLDAPKPKPRNQVRPPAEALHTTTKIPHHPVSAHPNTSTPQHRVTGAEDRGGPSSVPIHKKDTAIVIMISVFVVVGTVAVILATVCFVRLQNESRLAQKVDYPAFGGGSKSPPTANGTSVGDKSLAQSAQMYHYQHQKQQMLSMGKPKPEQKVLDSEVTSDEEEVGGDFTVYECPGLAPTGEMEVKNPLFDDSTLPVQGNHK
ncbi:neural proliferation differentiation and control protein 1a isoform X2 [Myripristis murdjan]|uniref:neural proliferation differentiation and control protein 1a isoform X2 n=1 Tax=Myripristis murdjan TaxID=586833 RepID=UPI001175CD7F|nr:neural proliferation differentiation and control protein 1-like isoform X2 [Myripristis murdjan]